MFKNIFSVPIYHGKLDNWKKYNRDLLPACQAVRKETEDMSENQNTPAPRNSKHLRNIKPVQPNRKYQRRTMRIIIVL